MRHFFLFTDHQMIAAYGDLLENVKIIQPDNNLCSPANFTDSCGGGSACTDMYYYDDLMSGGAIS